MIKSIAISKSQFFPLVLKYTDIRSYAFTAVFIALAVLLPWSLHQYDLAGPTFLPMHIFVLIAGLMFGWRAGLIVGLFTPMVSHFISGMPVQDVMPQIVIELSAYGFIAGILRQKYNLRTVWSLLGAIIGGRVALLLAILVLYLIVGQSYSPLGPEANPFVSVCSVIEQGWPGIVIQLALIPAIIWLVEKLITKKSM